MGGYRHQVLAGPLDRVASRTITNPGRLRAELDALAGRRAFASHGEGVEGVGATAVLIGAPRAEPKAALVTVYVFASQGQRRLADIRRATIRAAETITATIDGKFGESIVQVAADADCRSPGNRNRGRSNSPG